MKLLLILALLSITGLFIPASGQNVPQTTTANPVETVKTAKECKNAIEQDSNLTEAEKIVAKRECSRIAAKKMVGDIEGKEIRLKELRLESIVQCEMWHDNYKHTSKDKFKVQKPRGLADDCIILYNDEMWQHSGSDRIQKLLERANQIGLFEIAKAKAKLPESGMAPLKQLKAGIPKTHIDCKEGFILIHKITAKKPACVSLDSVDALIKRGWGSLKL